MKKNLEEDVRTFMEEQIPLLKHYYSLANGVFVEIVNEYGLYNLEIEVTNEDIGASYEGVTGFPQAEKIRDIMENELRGGGIKVCFREEWEILDD